MIKAIKLSFFVIFFVLAQAIYAVSFDVEVFSVKDKIVVNEVAEFDIKIHNNADTTQEFIVKKAGYPFWDMYTNPLQNPISLTVGPLDTQSIRLYVDPLYITSVDTYTLEVGVVKSSTGEELKAPVTIGIKSIDPLIGGYIPTVLGNVDMPQEMDPREEVTIRVSLNNQNVINYSNLTVKVENELFGDEVYVPLGPKEDIIVELRKKIDDKLEPQEGKVVVSVLQGDRVIVNPIVKEFVIKEYAIQQEIPRQQSFLRITKGIRVFSNNPKYSGTVMIETTPLKNLFSSTTPKAEKSKIDGIDYFVWQVELGPDRTASFIVTENYRPLVVIIALAAAAILLYFLFRSPLVVSKSVANIGMSEGGISDVKVVVKVKNRSASPITSIEVSDNVPHIAHVEKELSIGSMQPHAILQHPKKGIRIRWTLESLEAGDERVMSYKMKSRLPILGEFDLPAASARAKIGDKVVLSNSNRVIVGG